MTDQDGPSGAARPGTDPLLALLRAVAGRAAIAQRLQPPTTEALLHSIVDATVTLFDAEAASIALHEPAGDRLVFRVASGTAGAGAVGLAIRSSEGIAGYVFTTGQALAVADVAADPRFGREIAEASGYVPRSLLAVPLVDEEGPLGVLEVLDRRGDGTFGLRDIELATVFARQATVALRATRLDRDVADILGQALATLAGPETAEPAAEPAAVATALRDAIAATDRDDDLQLWTLADAVARAATAAPADIDLVVAILDLLAARPRGAGGPHARRTVPGEPPEVDPEP